MARPIRSRRRSVWPRRRWHLPDQAIIDRLETRLFIGGDFVPATGGARFTVHEPATGEALIEVAEAGAADLDKAAEAARAAFDRGPWRHLNPFDRGRVLQKIADLILADAPRIAEIETRSGGK